MTLSSFRLQLLLALGLPACTTTKPAPPPTTTPNAKGVCAKDQVHEWVCGLTDPKSEVARAGAPAPYEACGVNAIPLDQFDDFVFTDSSLWGNHDPGLATFTFDLERTKHYKYGGTVSPGDTWCCYQRCDSLTVVTPRSSLAKGLYEHEVCVPAPESGTSKRARTAPQCPAGVKLRYRLPDDTGIIDAAPFANLGDKGECCYAVASTRKCSTSTLENDKGECVQPSPGGRPVRELGVPVVARATRRGDWADTFVLPRDAAAAAAWSREGAAEHASVAAFARLAIDLMMVGAPPSLVEDAHLAARDEIRHAQLAYGLASAFAGEPVGPGPLPMQNPAREVTLVTLAVETFVDGCIGETVAAMAASEARVLASASPIRTALDTITADEARHAELAYRIVAWALRVGGEDVRSALRAELVHVRSELATPAAIAGDVTGFDERLGALSRAASSALRRRVLADVVIPCTEALLAKEIV